MKKKSSVKRIALAALALFALLFSLAYVADSSETMTKMWLQSTSTRAK